MDKYAMHYKYIPEYERRDPDHPTHVPKQKVHVLPGQPIDMPAEI